MGSKQTKLSVRLRLSLSFPVFLRICFFQKLYGTKPTQPGVGGKVTTVRSQTIHQTSTWDKACSRGKHCVERANKSRANMRPIWRTMALIPRGSCWFSAPCSGPYASKKYCRSWLSASSRSVATVVQRIFSGSSGRPFALCVSVCFVLLNCVFHWFFLY
jgi:hypothetical protein